MEPERPRKPKAAAKRTQSAVASKPAAKRAATARRPPVKASKTAQSVKPAKAAPKKMARPIPKETPSRSGHRLHIPALLLEGDRPAVSVPSGPGTRYALGPRPPGKSEEIAELPEAYGTRRLLVLARDPHWIYAHWDLTGEQLKACNVASRDGHLVLRVFKNEVSGKPVVEQPVHPESRNWFVHVPAAGTRYIAQIGYYDRTGRWNEVATSGGTLTPPDSLSSDTSVRFETIPVAVPFQKLIEIVKAAVAEHVPLVEALQELRSNGHPALPQLKAVPASRWTAEQERALAQIINIDEVRRVWMGSLEITELIRRQLEQEISSQAAAALARGEQFGAAEISGVFSVSSPFGGEEKRKGFWCSVNAELIIYGATEPDATVTIGGRRIQLRRDGTFSFRFALPDGQYELPVQATSADGEDTRRAQLEFRRRSKYRGAVDQHPQDAALKTPHAENVA